MTETKPRRFKNLCQFLCSPETIEVEPSGVAWEIFEDGRRDMAGICTEEEIQRWIREGLVEEIRTRWFRAVHKNGCWMTGDYAEISPSGTASLVYQDGTRTSVEHWSLAVALQWVTEGRWVELPEPPAPAKPEEKPAAPGDAIWKLHNATEDIIRSSGDPNLRLVLGLAKEALGACGSMADRINRKAGEA